MVRDQLVKGGPTPTDLTIAKEDLQSLISSSSTTGIQVPPAIIPDDGLCPPEWGKAALAVTNSIISKCSYLSSRSREKMIATRINSRLLQHELEAQNLPGPHGFLKRAKWNNSTELMHMQADTQ